MRKRGQQQPRAAQDTRISGMMRAAKAFTGFRPAHSVLRVVRAVPTRFIQFDHATKVGGLPIERFMLMHGPSGEGKTYCSLGLIDSFLAGDHYAMLVDAERTTPITWPDQLMGERARHPGFFAMRPSSYEDTVQTVRDFVLTLKKQRDEKVIREDTTALIVVDSLRKLVPKNIFAKIVKDTEKNGVDGMGGRAAQIKAAMNAQWMDELIPLLEETRTTFVAIARETDDGDADKWTKMAGNDFKVGGGKAIYYDASLVMRVERDKYITDGGDDEGKNKKVFGERHRITIRKTKVSGHEDKMTECFFHTSNGVLTPFGFDRARDVIELAEKFGVIEKRGHSYRFEDQALGVGINKAVLNLTGNVEWLDKVEAATRAQFKSHKPVEFNADGEFE